MTAPEDHFSPEDTGIDLEAIEARANAAKHSPWTSSPQEGAPGHCFQAQVWDENGRSMAVLEPSIVPDLATATAAHIAGLHPEVVLALIAEIRRLRSRTHTDAGRDEAEVAISRTDLDVLHHMARRYADGRRSYAVGQFNDITRKLVTEGKIKPEYAQPDKTIWARDGDGKRSMDGLSDEEAALGEDWVNRDLARIQSERDPTRTAIARAVEAMERLVNAKALAGVRELVAGWNGEGKADGPYERHPAKLGATLPKVNCGAVYELDEAMVAASESITSLRDLVK